LLVGVWVGVRHLTRMRMVVKITMLAGTRRSWGDKQLGVYMGIFAAEMVMMERGDLWPSKKAQERDNNGKNEGEQYLFMTTFSGACNEQTPHQRSHCRTRSAGGAWCCH
jgi:hypothetical protein